LRARAGAAAANGAFRVTPAHKTKLPTRGEPPLQDETQREALNNPLRFSSGAAALTRPPETCRRPSPLILPPPVPAPPTSSPSGQALATPRGRLRTRVRSRDPRPPWNRWLQMQIGPREGIGSFSSAAMARTGAHDPSLGLDRSSASPRSTAPSSHPAPVLRPVPVSPTQKITPVRTRVSSGGPVR